MASRYVLFTDVKDEELENVAIQDGQIVVAYPSGQMFLDEGSSRYALGGTPADSTFSKTSTNPLQNQAISNNILNSLTDAEAVTKDGVLPSTKVIKQLDEKLSAEDISLSNTISSNYTTLDNKIDSNTSKLDGKISSLTTTVNNNYSKLLDTYNTLSNTVSSNYATLDNKIDSRTNTLGNAIDQVAERLDNVEKNLYDYIKSEIDSVYATIKKYHG